MPVPRAIADPYDTAEKARVVDGKLQVEAELTVGDIEIGAVELKNATTDDRATINTDGELSVTLPDVEITVDGQVALAAAVINDVYTREVPLTTPANGKKTVTTAGTAVQLGTATNINTVTIKALNTNDGTIYIGDSGVDSTNGYELQRGDSLSLDIDNLTSLYIDSDNDGEGVSYITLT